VKSWSRKIKKVSHIGRPIIHTCHFLQLTAQSQANTVNPSQHCNELHANACDGKQLRGVHVFIHLDDCAVNAFRQYLSRSRKEASRQIKGEQGGVVERERAPGCSKRRIGTRMSRAFLRDTFVEGCGDAPLA
jgi:hypothetical protein